jgi:DNA polymerase III subunit delta'
MNLIGHQKIINLLERSVKNSNIAQAYLFSGPEAAGKFTLAKIFAKGIIAGSDFSETSDGNNPLDLIIIEPEKEEKRGVIKEKDIKIEEIREAQKSLLIYPYAGKYKVLIINNAHRMNESAQNSLLKILEEPNNTSIIILVTHEPKRILSTIKSRSQKIIFSLVGQGDMRAGLENNGLKASQQLINLSLGRPGIAIELSQDENKLKERIEIIESLGKIMSLGINERLDMAEKFSKNVSETINNLELWIWILHAGALGEKNKALENFRLVELIEESIATLTRTNASSRLVLENLLINL